MRNTPTKTRLDKIPKLYATENIPLKEKEVHLHFFFGGCDWYVVEYDGKDLFFGYAILHNDFMNAEWGYMSFSELKELSIRGMEIDCELEKYFPIIKAGFIAKIQKGNDW
jgi:hypothetical protein